MDKIWNKTHIVKMYESQSHAFWAFVGDQSGSDGPDVVGLLAYSVFAHDLYKWVKHQQKLGNSPTQVDIDSHIFRDLHEDYYKDIRNRSVQAFDKSARVYLARAILETSIESQNSAIVTAVEKHNSAVLAEMRKTGGFWRQVALALITAIVAPLVLGGAIAAIYNFDRFFPTATWFADQAKPNDRPSEGQ